MIDTQEMKEERKRRTNVQVGITNVILDNCETDEEFFQNLLFALSKISNELLRFKDDIKNVDNK